MKCAALNPTWLSPPACSAAHKTRPKHISAKQIIERTARHFQVPMEEILGSKRDKDIVVPRQVAMYILAANCT